MCGLSKNKYFTVLVVVSNKEKEACGEMCFISFRRTSVCINTKEENGQRWLMIDLYSDDEVYQDLLQLIRIRRKQIRDRKNGDLSDSFVV